MKLPGMKKFAISNQKFNSNIRLKTTHSNHKPIELKSPGAMMYTPIPLKALKSNCTAKTIPQMISCMTCVNGPPMFCELILCVGTVCKKKKQATYQVQTIHSTKST